jgi:hypothetical protein
MGRAAKKILNPIKKAVKKIVGFVGDFFGFNIKPMGAPDVGNTDATEQGILVTKTGTNEGIPVIYGFRRVGGTVIYAETSGTNNAFLYVVYVVGEGEIDGYRRLIVDDTSLVSPQGTGYYATDTVLEDSGATPSRYFGKIKFELFKGTENQTQSVLLAEAPSWKDKRRTLPGVAYAVFRFAWSTDENNPYNGGVPNLQFEVYGKKVYDVTTHTTGAQLSATYPNLAKTWGTTSPFAGTNPANCLLDYMMNPRYGCGISRDEIDADSFKIAAAKFNQTVTYYAGVSGPAMTCNAVLDSKQKLLDNVKILIGGCRGMLPYVQGRYKLIVEDGGHPTLINSGTAAIAYAVNKSHIVGGITLTGETKTTKYNQVIVNYVEPSSDFSNQQAVFNLSADKVIDSNEELSGEYSFPTVINQMIALDLARMIYLKSRNQVGIEFDATQELIDVIPGDIITVTDTTLNLSAKQFRVVNVKLNVDGTVALSCTEHVASNYPYQINQSPTPPQPPQPVDPVPPGPTPPPVVPPEQPGIIIPPPTDPIVPPPAPSDRITLYAIPYAAGSVNEQIYRYNTNHPILRYKYANYAENGSLNIGTSNGQPIGTVARFDVLAPADSTITQMRIQTFNGNTEIVNFTSYYWGNFSFGNLQPNGVRIPAGYGNKIWNKNYQYRVRALKYISGNEYEYRMGGDFSWAIGWSGSYTYRLLGQTITGSDLEAFFNFLVSKYGESTGGSASLGG